VRDTVVFDRVGDVMPGTTCALVSRQEKGDAMPEKATVKKAKAKMRTGKRASTAAGEFVREEIHHIREGKHGARSAKQAIAIGLSKARRAGIKVTPPRKGQASKETRAAARRANEAGKRRRSPSKTRSRAMERALRKEPRRAASHRALSAHAHKAAMKRTRADRSRSARKAAKTRASHRSHQ
jgi:hypothetical protein